MSANPITRVKTIEADECSCQECVDDGAVYAGGPLTVASPLEQWNAIYLDGALDLKKMQDLVDATAARMNAELAKPVFGIDVGATSYSMVSLMENGGIQIVTDEAYRGGMEALGVKIEDPTDWRSKHEPDCPTLIEEQHCTCGCEAGETLREGNGSAAFDRAVEKLIADIDAAHGLGVSDIMAATRDVARGS